VLDKLGDKYHFSNWTEASTLFSRSGTVIMDLCKAALNHEKQQASDFLLEIAGIEEQAYRLLKDT